MSFCFLRTMKTVSPSSGTLETTNIQVQKPLTRSRSMKLGKSCVFVFFIRPNLYPPWNTKGVVNAVSWEGENKLRQSSGCSKNTEYCQQEIPHNQRCPQLERLPLGHEILAPEDHEEVHPAGPPTPWLSRINHTRTFYYSWQHWPTHQLPVVLHPHPDLWVLKFLGKKLLWTWEISHWFGPVQNWTCRNSFFLDPPSPSQGCCPGPGPQRGMRTSLSLILSLILISGGEMMSLWKYFQYLYQRLFNRAFNRTSIRRRYNLWIFARLLAVMYSSSIFWTIAYLFVCLFVCLVVHVTGADHDRGHQAGDGGEMDDGSGQGGDRALSLGCS